MAQRRITEADTPTIWVGIIPSGLISNTPPSSSHFYARCAPAATLQIIFILAWVRHEADFHTQWHGLGSSGKQLLKQMWR